MKIQTLTIAMGTAVVVILGSLLTTPYIFYGRIMPGVALGSLQVGGIQTTDLDSAIKQYQEDLGNIQIRVRLQNQIKTVALHDLGVTIDQARTKQLLLETSDTAWLPTIRSITPFFALNETASRSVLHEAFKSGLQLPTNATLALQTNNQLTLVPGRSGQQVDVVSLERDIHDSLRQGLSEPFTLVIISAAAPIQDTEVEFARSLAATLLQDGLKLTMLDQTFDVKPFTIRRLITFQEQAHPNQPNNAILGVQLHPVGLKEYLDTTIAPAINRGAINAKFEMVDGKVKQFAVPQEGHSLNFDATIAGINETLRQGQASAAVAVDRTEPDIRETADIEALGVATLIARGETDFQGSPKNRVHNITVGASRYHGLLIPPNTEFSVLQYLGPVDGQHDFKPELVIKTNVTVPEFGGGLCQVSTTVFRTAIEAGLKITQRRNHSYAVHYYGTPGFDATIYPPYTDLRFLNNTPAYILIQTKIEGTKLIFEFWGTDDGRTVAIDGPHPYNRQIDGAVKAYLKQTVAAQDGTQFIEDTFYSNYKSPKLFPRVLAANSEPTPSPASTPPSHDPSATPPPSPTPHPQP